MEEFVDKSRITYKSHTKEMRNFFFFYHSKAKESYVSATGVHSRCKIPCDLDHPYYWSNMPFNEHYNNKTIRTDEQAIGCFGCSNTYGSFIKNDETWPYLLGKSLKINCVNFGVGAAGIDSIFLNLKASAKDYKFKKVIIVLPSFGRMVARINHLGNWFRWPVMPEHATLWQTLLPTPIHEDLKLENDILIKHGKNVIDKIIADKKGKYQKKVLARLIKFCSKTYEKFYITSWNQNVYEYISSNYKKYVAPMYDLSGPTASDGLHPTIIQNRRFVKNFIKFSSHQPCSLL